MALLQSWGVLFHRATQLSGKRDLYFIMLELFRKRDVRRVVNPNPLTRCFALVTRL